MTTDELLAYVIIGVLGLFLISGLWFVVLKGLAG
jgi:hypothetical protein